MWFWPYWIMWTKLVARARRQKLSKILNCRYCPRKEKPTFWWLIAANTSGARWGRRRGVGESKQYYKKTHLTVEFDTETNCYAMCHEDYKCWPLGSCFARSSVCVSANFVSKKVGPWESSSTWWLSSSSLMWLSKIFWKAWRIWFPRLMPSSPLNGNLS